jgi:hypothetical protein
MKLVALEDHFGVPVRDDGDNMFTLNPRPSKAGHDPKEIIDTADALRAKLITVFGPSMAKATVKDFIGNLGYAYNVLEPAIRATFDWNRLGNKHDNETAHAYQYIVNALYFVGKADGSHAPEYQQDLRDAFDGNPVADRRTASESNDGEYLVLTEAEANLAVAENIKESLWAFNAEWMAGEGFIRGSVVKSLQKMQEEMCEGANDIILDMVGDKFRKLVDRAVQADSRGRFLSSYDGKEIQVGDYFAYCYNKPWRNEE